LPETGAFLQVDCWFWSSIRNTPFWLKLGDKEWIKKDNWNNINASREALSILEHETPSRLIFDNDRLLVPLYIPTHVEKDEVINSLLEQLKEVSDLLKQ